jgi:hypothetical protein
MRSSSCNAFRSFAGRRVRARTFSLCSCCVSLCLSEELAEQRVVELVAVSSCTDQHALFNEAREMLSVDFPGEVTLRLIGFNRVNRTQFRQSDWTERPRFHSRRQSDANAGPLTYTARSLPQPQFEIEGDLRLRSGRALCVFGHSAVHLCTFCVRF